MTARFFFLFLKSEHRSNAIPALHSWVVRQTFGEPKAYLNRIEESPPSGRGDSNEHARVKHYLFGMFFFLAISMVWADERSAPGAGKSVLSPPGTMQPFSTDGCSHFPDRSLISKSDWCNCCIAHDLAYWRGGTSEARLKADQALKACVQHAANSALAELMFAGVRAGGGPYFYTSYRWGYGWPFGRPYGSLTPEEEALASSLERAYFVKNPPPLCPSQAP
jgi:hypothetical protein